jgi:hypothetical protein
MKIFNCRSPYIITIDEGNAQIATKLEITIWRTGTVQPITPTKTLEKTKYSTYQYKNYYNISPFVYDYINTFSNVDLEFAYSVYIKKYADLGTGFEEFSDEYLVAVNGYNDYDNQNFNYTTSIAILNTNGTTYNATGYDVNYYYDTNTIPEIDLIIDFTSTTSEYRIKYSTTAFVEDHYETYFSYVNYINDGSIFQDRKAMVVAPDDGIIVSTIFEIQEFIPDMPKTTIYTCKLIANCEQKYNPFALEYVNRLGGKQTMTLFKNSNQSINVKASDYNSNTYSKFYFYPNYDPLYGQKRVFNKNGSKTIKCNTGWLREDENINIQDIFLSEMLYLTSADGTIDAAVTLKNTSQQFKTHLNEKVINYELEFEVASSLINNVI